MARRGFLWLFGAVSGSALFVFLHSMPVSDNILNARLILYPPNPTSMPPHKLQFLNFFELFDFSS